MFDDFDKAMQVADEISRDDLDFEGVYDYIQSEDDNDSVSKFCNYAKKMHLLGYNFDY